MDWLTLLLIFIFFVLPLIQQIAEARRRGSEPPLEPPGAEEEWEYEEELPPGMEVDRGRRAEQQPRTLDADGNWSEGWGSWPGETPPPPPVPEPARSRAPEVRQPEHVQPDTARWDRGRDRVPVEREVPVRLERPAPVPRPERVLVERGIPVEPVHVERHEESRRPRERKHALSRPAAGAVRSVSPMAAVLHEGNQLRRALILSEIIGPPRSVRPLEEDQK